jgi:hypothetical protein
LCVKTIQIAGGISLRTQHHTFFALVGGTWVDENYLSRLFQASFANSLAFRRCALSTLWKNCALPPPAPKDVQNWECYYQPSTPTPGGGYPDLALQPGEGTSFAKTIYLESKVRSKLTKQQLKRYKDYGATVLVAVTKNRPEVSQSILKQMRVKTLRWQDFCRALRHTPVRGQQEKFLCHSFAEYLEESGMAYRENMTKYHLRQICALLNKIGLHGKVDGIKPGLTFNYAHNCLELLREVRASLLERLPKLSKLHAWGPGYFHFQEDGQETIQHGLGFTFARKWGKGEPRFAASFYFDPNGSAYWVVEWSAKENVYSIDSISSPIKNLSGRTTKELDADLMAKTVEKAARKWRVV